MSHIEKTIKRDDGSRVRMIADFTAGWSDPDLKISVAVRAPGKRKFEALFDRNDFAWRKLDHLGKLKHVRDQVEKLLTKEEIDQFIDEVAAELAARFKNEVQFAAW